MYSMIEYLSVSVYLCHSEYWIVPPRAGILRFDTLNIWLNSTAYTTKMSKDAGNSMIIMLEVGGGGFLCPCENTPVQDIWCEFLFCQSSYMFLPLVTTHICNCSVYSVFTTPASCDLIENLYQKVIINRLMIFNYCRVCLDHIHMFLQPLYFLNNIVKNHRLWDTGVNILIIDRK